MSSEQRATGNEPAAKTSSVKVDLDLGIDIRAMLERKASSELEILFDDEAFRLQVADAVARRILNGKTEKGALQNRLRKDAVDTARLRMDAILADRVAGFVDASIVGIIDQKKVDEAVVRYLESPENPALSGQPRVNRFITTVVFNRIGPLLDQRIGRIIDEAKRQTMDRLGVLVTDAFKDALTKDVVKAKVGS